MKNRKIDMSDIEDNLVYKHGYMQEHVDKLMEQLKEIDSIRKEKNAVILAHYYQIPPIQLIADMRGDSLKLAQAAENIKDKGLVVSSTVHFMAEMVKLLSPDKKVVTPALNAGCSIAEGMNGESVRRMRDYFPDAKIISYINTNADVKAEVDSVCTSANARTIVENIGGDKVIMIPDYYFAKNIFKEMPRNGREFLAYRGMENGHLTLEDVVKGKEYRIDVHNPPELDRGICVVHEQFTPDEIKYLKKKDKIDVVMAHPEVSPEVAAVSDMVGGTGKMLDYVGNTKHKKFLVITECDLTAPLKEMYTDREFITPCKLCPYMKKNSVDGF